MFWLTVSASVILITSCPSCVYSSSVSIPSQHEFTATWGFPFEILDHLKLQFGLKFHTTSSPSRNPFVSCWVKKYKLWDEGCFMSRTWFAAYMTANIDKLVRLQRKGPLGVTGKRSEKKQNFPALLDKGSHSILFLFCFSISLWSVNVDVTIRHFVLFHKLLL